MLPAVTIIIVLLGLKLSHFLVVRFGRARGYWSGLFLQCLSGKASVASRLCTGIGALMVICAVLLALERGLFVLTAERTTGTIKSLVESSSKEGEATYAPEFSFVDDRGQKHTTQSSLYGPLDEYKIGQQVPVLYSSFWFGRSAIDAYDQVWGLTTALAIIGSMLLGAGTVRLYWTEISAYHEKAPTPVSWPQKLSRQLFRLMDNFFEMPGSLRFGTFVCVGLVFLLPFILLTDPGVAENELLEMSALAGIAFIIAGGLLCRSRWVRPAAAFASLVIFYNAFADEFWLIALIVFFAQVVVPICYLYLNPSARAYFNREVARKGFDRGSLELSMNDSAGQS
jgi:hypothetical protein